MDVDGFHAEGNGEGSSVAAANSSGAQGEKSSLSDGEEEEEEDAASLSNELRDFRVRWMKELDESPRRKPRKMVKGQPQGFSPRETCNPIRVIAESEEERENQAKEFYMSGMRAEDHGQLYEAIQFYRRAVQIVPDIDSRVSNMIPKFQDCSNGNEGEGVNDNNGNEGCVEEEFDLVARFIRMSVHSMKRRSTIFDQRMMHISMLPREVMTYLFKWVVSSELDMKSLEQLSLVCRSFYLVARDPEIWRLACMRIWGANCGLPNKFESWRGMFIERPRLRFDGVYISKTTYIRPGETSFQDQNYRPWYTVDYFRYMRFLPDGTALMLTTSDEPPASIYRLHQRSGKHPAILSGHYRVNGSVVTAVLKRPNSEQMPSVIRYRRQRYGRIVDQVDQTFHVELEVKSCNRKRNYKLEWKRYTTRVIYGNGHENSSEFNLTLTNFPPFWFSRVKSYVTESESPLQ